MKMIIDQLDVDEDNVFHSAHCITICNDDDFNDELDDDDEDDDDDILHWAHDRHLCSLWQTLRTCSLPSWPSF